MVVKRRPLHCRSRAPIALARWGDPLSVPLAARNVGITLSANNLIDRKHSSRVKSPKANCPTT